MGIKGLFPPRLGRGADGRGPPGEEVNGLFPGRACGGRGMFIDEGDGGAGGRGLFTGATGALGGVCFVGFALLSVAKASPLDGGALGFDSCTALCARS